MPRSTRVEVLWFKRDLRVRDQRPLVEACTRARDTSGWVLRFYPIKFGVIRAPDYAGRL